MTSFEAQFEAFSKFGDTHSDGKSISLSQSDKWMKQANVFNKNISTTDTAIHFKKLKSQKLDVTQYVAFLEDMTTTKKMNLDEIKNKMASCGEPGVKRATVSGAAKSNVDRMTDTTKYTGSHKERFDESGKGKGIEGRKSIAEKDGYVSGYKGKDTYDKAH